MNIIERTINDVAVLDIEDNLALNENARLQSLASLRVLKELKKPLIDRCKSNYRLKR
jgi:hypothetical protein